ncbi:GRIP domain protein [Ancylostoma duodenale]|uniref:GRIP domain protein n=1 Tax=Ancylostoma duodenale TaxID=51022 RepID=A0A0C2DF84_9BILA|nr:GRIP domain protein [Ancylostoma duodenale]
MDIERNHQVLTQKNETLYGSPLFYLVLWHVMAAAPPDGDPPGNPARSKLDNLSRDDLIRFVKKQLEHVRLSKVAADNFKKTLEEKDSLIRDLEDEIAALRDSLSSERDVVSIHASAEVENGECANLVNEHVIEENSELKSEIAMLKKDRIRIEDDLAAALEANSELRSKLDDALQEAAALREQQTATDVFSLELKDYEKKMVQLNKSLKEAQMALETCTTEKNELTEQLTAHKNSSDRVSTECSTLMAQLHDAKQELFEEQRRAAELQSSLDRLQDNFNVLATARNDERVAFEEKITQNETLVDLLRRNAEQKQMELRSVTVEKDLLKTRLEDLENDYESYKSRARYVLEQKAQSSSEQLHSQLDLSATNSALFELRNSLEALQLAHDEALREARRDRELREKAETAVRVAKAQTVETLDQMASVREELFNSNIMLKDRITECATYQRQLAGLEKKLYEENKENARLIQTLRDDLAKKERIESELTEEVKKAKQRCHKAMNLLEDWKSHRTSPPSAENAPQTSVTERPVPLHPPAPVDVSPKASVFTAVQPEIQYLWLLTAREQQFMILRWSSGPVKTPQIWQYQRFVRIGSTDAALDALTEISLYQLYALKNAFGIIGATMPMICGHQEETLEEILFGDSDANTEANSGDAPTMLSVPALVEEIERLNKNLQHARELLNETEATNATLVDQSRLLKEEIRRLQRNEERLNHVENTEYLKNIIIKFLSPERVSGERQQLIPILSTMLQLSPDEVENLNRAAAQDDAATRESDNSWGSFLRWGRLN